MTVLTKKQFSQRLKTINWQPILSQMPQPSAQTIQSIRRYQALLFLIDRYPQTVLVPTQEIDAVLHLHAADVPKFRADCHRLGRRLHHAPGLGTRGSLDRHQWLLAFNHTQLLFERHFGQGSMGQSLPACCEIFELRCQ